MAFSPEAPPKPCTLLHGLARQLIQPSSYPRLPMSRGFTPHRGYRYPPARLIHPRSAPTVEDTFRYLPSPQSSSVTVTPR